MKLFTNHIIWWCILLVATVAVSVITSQSITVTGLIRSVAAHLVFATGISLIPWLFYRIIGKPMNTEEMMSTITVAWLILAVANLWAMP